jgi:glycerophosphoryl diester phosphodiesterase
MRTWMTLLLIASTSIVNGQNYYIAHRGASSEAPENTLAAVKLAWESGVDAVEVDVHLTMDNRVMVIHDKDTRRTSNGKNFNIAATPSVVLRDLDAGSWKDPKFKGERIPFLEEIIGTIPEGKTLIIEVKCGSEIIPHLERILNKKPGKSKLIFISFGWETIVDIRKAFPDYKTYWLSDSKKSAIKKLQQIDELKINGLDMQSTDIDEELVRMAGQYHLDVIAWTVDDPAEAKRLSALGITHFTSNRADWLKQQLNP